MYLNEIEIITTILARYGIKFTRCRYKTCYPCDLDAFPAIFAVLMFLAGVLLPNRKLIPFDWVDRKYFVNYLFGKVESLKLSFKMF